MKLKVSSLIISVSLFLFAIHNSTIYIILSVIVAFWMFSSVTYLKLSQVKDEMLNVEYGVNFAVRSLQFEDVARQ